jgi:uncharacterized membrane protein (UPF0127 family)
MQHSSPGRRFAGSPTATIGGIEVPVATGPRARLLGLAGLALEAAGSGLLIPRCSSIHTFGMRFLLDLVFLDAGLRPLAIRGSVPPRRLAWRRGAVAVLELPARAGARGPAFAPDSGEFGRGGGEPGLVPPE